MGMIPVGEYDGHVHGWVGFLNWIWTGKHFVGNTVLNKVGGRWVVTGQVSEHEDGTVRIVYPQFGGLTDILTPTKADGSAWDGTMDLFGRTIRFTLTQKE